MTVDQLNHPDDRDRDRELYEQLTRRDAPLAGRQSEYTVEKRYRRKDGSAVWVLVTTNAICDEKGVVERVFSVVQDISVQIQVKRQIAESELRYRSLVSVITDVPWTTDADGRFVTPQPAWSSYTGQTWDQYKDFGWVDALHPHDRESVTELWRISCESGCLYRSTGRVWHEPTGEYRYFQARAAPIIDESVGAVIREWVGTCTDVHEQVVAEMELRAADQRKDEFLAILAHELRNPLAPVINGLEFLMQSTETRTPDIAETIASMRRQAGQLNRLVDDLLDVNRISSGKIELKRTRVDLKTCIEQAVAASRGLADCAEQLIAVKLPAEPILLNGDSARLVQIFGNLLNNACRYSDRGGRITVSTWRDVSDVVVSVKDHGIGIPSNRLDDIFLIFSQIERSHDRSGGGLGIGLHLVRRLVELHGGLVTAYSEGLGRGSEFVVRLPIEGPVDTAPELTSEPKTDFVESRRRRILIVDDNRDAAFALARLLRATGNETQTAFDGIEATSVAERFRPDVILLDIGLPRMNGWDVCRTIRQKSSGKKPAIIAMTGWGQDDDRRKSLEAGFDGHLVKPVDYASLRQLLDNS
jgi:PAS domain S-box-containing protein